MRNWYVLTAALLGLALILTACGEQPLMSQVSIDKEVITPNADGDTDALRITYNLNRAAEVSIHFEDQRGKRYYFRRDAYRGPSVEQAYQVLFSGVVDGYTLPGEQFEGFTVEKRVLQDGVYTWMVEATEKTGHTERVTGTLTIADADTALPELRNFTVSPPSFTPNRDGIGDRVKMNVYLSKEVESLTLYLLGEDDTRYPVSHSDHSPAREGEPGQHLFDYDAGVDHGAEPPSDGTYPVVMEAQDAMGQWTSATNTLTIEEGGVPRAYIYNAEVEWPASEITLGDTLYFTLTVENDGTAPLRTSGPPPGTVYESNENYATLEEDTQSGVFRVGIHCENEPINYPWRWAVGDESALVERGGQVYLPVDSKAVVTGGIRFVDVGGARNPQYCWAGLIHEDVEISQVNTHVDAVFLQIVEP